LDHIIFSALRSSCISPLSPSIICSFRQKAILLRIKTSFLLTFLFISALVLASQTHPGPFLACPLSLFILSNFVYFILYP